MIKYKTGNLFELIDDFEGITYIPHVVNNKGLWKSGFVRAIDRYCPEAKQDYLNYINAYGSDNLLGTNSWSKIHDFSTYDSNTYIVHMFAQTFAEERALYYNHLSTCMDKIAEYAYIDKRDYGKESRVICPKFGSLRAGGDWNFIEKLIEDCWIRNGIDVTVVEYAEEKVYDYMCDRCNVLCEELYGDENYCRKCYQLHLKRL